MNGEVLDDALIRMYARTLYGYRSYDAPWWFVGMEEGGGDDLDKVRARLYAWDRRGRRELEDLAEFHRAFSEGRWFDGDRPPTQRTWRSLIRILLAAGGGKVPLEAVRRYQVERLGRDGGETALLELLPLPSPSIDRWSYHEWTSVPQLSDRGSYLRYYAPRRAAYLRRKREEHRPLVVVYYGLHGNYQRWWECISGVSLNDHNVEGQRVRVGRDPGTIFVVIPHPNARRVTNTFCHGVGHLISWKSKQLRRGWAGKNEDQ